MTSPIDLTTVPSARNWIGGLAKSTPANPSFLTDANLQACITAASAEILRITGRGPQNALTALLSPFVQPFPYVETYSGNGNPEIYLRNFPVTAISAVTISTQSVPQSTGQASAGYAVGPTGRSVYLVVGGGASVDTFQNFFPYGGGLGAGGARRYGFPYGLNNVQVSYTAGFPVQVIANELQTVVPAWAASTVVTPGQIVSGGGYQQQCVTGGTTGTALPSWNAPGTNVTQDGSVVTWLNTGIPSTPNTVIVGSYFDGYNWLSNTSVAYFSDGTLLTQVQVSPAVGEYYIVSPGVYLFNAADAGEQVLISYNAAGTPPDIVLAVNQMVALNYARRQWVGVSSIAMKDVGSTSYTTWAIDPVVKQALAYYIRRSI